MPLPPGLDEDSVGNPVFSMRISPEEKETFRKAAEREDKKLGTWLKMLARLRVAQQSKESFLRRRLEEIERREAELDAKESQSKQMPNASGE